MVGGVGVAGCAGVFDDDDGADGDDSEGDTEDSEDDDESDDGGSGSEPDVDIQLLDSSELDVTQGDTFDVRAEIDVGGAVDGPREFELRIEDEVITTERLSLDADDGDPVSVSFDAIETADLEPGTYTYGVYSGDAAATGDLTVRADDAMTLVEETPLGEEHRAVRSMETRGERIYAAGMLNVDAARGAGDGLELWTKPGPDEDWEYNRLLEPDEMTLSMTNVFGGHAPDDPVFVSYSARGEYRGGVHVERVEPDGESRELFEHDDTGDSFLNSQGIHFPDEDRIDLFVPDRASPNNVRWFQLDPETGEELNRTFIEHDRFNGPRMYDTSVRDDGRIVFPVGNENVMLVVEADPSDQSYEVTQVDRYGSRGVGSDVFRMFSLLEFPEKGLYVLTGLRPARFSDRYEKGLLGEIIATSIDMYDLEQLDQRVVGGFDASQAATHYTNGARIGPSTLAVAYTAVDDDHYFHRTEEHDNYVHGVVTVWDVDDDGSLENRDWVTKEPFWNGVVASTRPGVVHKLYTETTADNRLWYDQWRVDVE